MQRAVPALCLILTIGACGGGGVKKPAVDYLRSPVKTIGAVDFFGEVPALCNRTRGIKQQTVRRVTNEQELRAHYGLTFVVRFNDGISPPLYGSMYYQNQNENRYCMALTSGHFAMFSDRPIGIKRNLIQEVCYPIQECF